MRIHPDDPAFHLDPLQGMAAKALSYVLGVRVELEGERLLVVPAEHDHARHRREFTSMCGNPRSFDIRRLDAWR